MRGLGITFEEAQRIQTQLEQQQKELQAAEADLRKQSEAVAAATRSSGAEISKQTAMQLTEIQKEELLRLQQTNRIRTIALVLTVLGAAGSVGLVMWLISKEKTR